jgi:hypothetical protein
VDGRPQERGELGVGGVDQDPAGAEDHHRQVAAVLAELTQQLPSGPRIVRIELVGHGYAGQHVAQLMRARLPLPADDPDRGERRLPRFAPGGQEVAERRVQPPLGRLPRCEQVIVDLSERHRPHRRVRSAVVAPFHQQDALGRRVQPMGGHQELDPAHPGHPLSGQQHRDRPRPCAQLAEGSQRRRRRALGHNLMISPEPAVKVSRKRLQLGAVLIHQEQDRPSRATLPVR